MYIYFDKQGVVKEVINNQAIRVASSNFDTLYFYFENDVDLSAIWLVIERPDGSSTIEQNIVLNKVIDEEIPYNKNQDLKFFQDYKPYDFYTYTLQSSDILGQNGLYKATIRAVSGPSIMAQGLITFNVENNVIKEDHNITQNQYDYLIEYVSKFVSDVSRQYIKKVSYNEETTIITFTLQDNSVYEITLLDFLNKQKGIPNGVAPLDINGVIPNKHIPLANELELGGIKARHVNGYSGPINEIVIDQNTARAFSTYNGTITFGTDYLNELGVEDLKSVVLENPTIGFIKRFNILKSDKDQTVDLTPYITINSDLTSGNINHQGYDLLANNSNVLFKLNTKNNRVLVFEKESDTPNIELSTRYYENQRYYLVKFTIKSDLTLNIGGVDFVTLEDLLKELMSYATKQYVDNKVSGTSNAIKEIHLFGENRVMVPYDTEVTNIDLYCHMIHIKGDPTIGVSNFDLYFEFYSSKNIPVNSIQDMKSLLGNGFYRSCNGLAMSKVVYAIYESNGVVKVKCTNTSEELLQGVDIEDMVKTI